MLLAINILSLDVMQINPESLLTVSHKIEILNWGSRPQFLQGIRFPSVKEKALRLHWNCPSSPVQSRPDRFCSCSITKDLRLKKNWGHLNSVGFVSWNLIGVYQKVIIDDDLLLLNKSKIDQVVIVLEKMDKSKKSQGFFLYRRKSDSLKQTAKKRMLKDYLQVHIWGRVIF